MREFFLSENMNFPFKNFGIQHIMMLIFTIICFIFIFIYRKKFTKLNIESQKKIRLIIGLIILISMLSYRISYMYYGVYDIKKHLSLYYCHIVNYIFVLSLVINNKKFYKIVYILSWISLITIVFPDISTGIDSYIFYQFFISHNLLIVFSTFMLVLNNQKIELIDLFKGIIIANFIILFTYVINFDFGTNFNTPLSIFYGTIVSIYKYTYFEGCLFLNLIALIDGMIGYLVSKVYYISSKQENKEKKL